ncbi:MAG: MarR family winged helix-turn-helix transcriptional regulator [Ferrimicrobium sp.]
MADALYSLATATVRRMPRNISLSAIATLRTLERCGPLRISHLASIERVAQPTMTVLIIRLERVGLAERRSDVADRRGVLVTLTPAGEHYLRARRQAGADSMALLVNSLPTQQVEALRDALPAILRICELADADTNTPDLPVRASSGTHQ